MDPSGASNLIIVDTSLEFKDFAYPIYLEI
jgi:hypothetical protein